MTYDFGVITNGASSRTPTGLTFKNRRVILSLRRGEGRSG
jgi:hypothetical protein